MTQQGLQRPWTEAQFSEARALAGRWLRRTVNFDTASQDAVGGWALAIGDRNPLWLDAGYARRSPFGCLVAPPCWLYAVDFTDVAPKLSGLHAIYAGADWTFLKPVRLNDEIAVRARLLGVEEKQGRFAGPMLLQTGEVLYCNQRDEVVARAVSRVFRTSREEAVRRAKYASITRHRYAAEELRRIEDAYDAEAIRGEEPRYWEDVQEGEALPPVVKGPLTTEDMLIFVARTRPVRTFQRAIAWRRRHPADAFRQDAGWWDTWEESWLDDSAARRFGFPAAHDTGVQRIAWLGNLLTNWMSDYGWLRALSVRLTLPTILGDTTWCKGTVARKYTEGADHLVTCAVWCEDQGGARTTEGTAEVALLSRSVGAG